MRIDWPISIYCKLYVYGICIRKLTSKWLRSTSAKWKLSRSIIFDKRTKCPTQEKRMSVMRVGSRTPATSKMDIFMAIVKEWELSKIVTNSSILDVTVNLDSIWVVWNQTSAWVFSCKFVAYFHNSCFHINIFGWVLTKHF